MTYRDNNASRGESTVGECSSTYTEKKKSTGQPGY